LAKAEELAAWKDRLQEHWPAIEILEVEAEPLSSLQVGDEVHARARVKLDPLTPDDVQVEFYMGLVDTNGEIEHEQVVDLAYAGPDDGEGVVFEGTIGPCEMSGLYGYTVRVLPSHPALATPFLPGLITWAGDEEE
jgi:starch phosphorylase